MSPWLMLGWYEEYSSVSILRTTVPGPNTSILTGGSSGSVVARIEPIVSVLDVVVGHLGMVVSLPDNERGPQRVPPEPQVPNFESVLTDRSLRPSDIRGPRRWQVILRMAQRAVATITRARSQNRVQDWSTFPLPSMLRKSRSTASTLIACCMVLTPPYSGLGVTVHPGLPL